MLGRDEIGRLLAACLPHYRPPVATALYTGMRTSELLGLVWGDVDLRGGVIHVSAQLSRAYREAPARRVPPKTPASVRETPLVPQLAAVLREHRRGSTFTARDDWVFGTRHGTPLGYRNVERRALNRAARIAGLDGGGRPPLRFHDLRHTFASHLIVDLHLDPAQEPHPRPCARDDHPRRLHPPLRRGPPRGRIRARMGESPFAQLLGPNGAKSKRAGLVALAGGHAT